VPARNRAGHASVAPSMLQPWLQDLESLEAITRSDDARKIFLKMAALSRSGRMPSFLAEIEHDQELDEATKGHLVELARDRSFLVAVEEYLRRTERLH
jgi:glycogen debranching enzyme